MNPNSFIKHGLALNGRSSVGSDFDIAFIPRSGLKIGTMVMSDAITITTRSDEGIMGAWANPTGGNILILDVIFDVTTDSTNATATLNVGVAADATTESDTLIDGADIGAAGPYVRSATGNPGTNGKPNRKMSSTQYITFWSEASAAALVATAHVIWVSLP